MVRAAGRDYVNYEQGWVGICFLTAKALRTQSTIFCYWCVTKQKKIREHSVFNSCWIEELDRKGAEHAEFLFLCAFRAFAVKDIFQAECPVFFNHQQYPCFTKFTP